MTAPITQDVLTIPRKLPAAGLNFALSSCYTDLFKRDADYLKVLIFTARA